MTYEQLKLLIFGFPGSGKTVLVSTVLDLPAEGYLPALLLDFEEGQRSIRSKCVTVEAVKKEVFDPRSKTTVVRSTYDVEQLRSPVTDKLNRVVVETWEDFREVYRILTKEVPLGTYKTLIIDSLSQVDRKCQDAVAKNSMGEPFDVKPITQPEMGNLQTHMVWLIQAFLRTRAHLICTAHITSKDDPGQSGDTNLPMLTTIRLRQEVCAICDAVGYTYTYDSKEFNLSFSKSAGVFAKFRAENPHQVAGKVFSSHIDPAISKNQFNLASFLKAIGDIPNE